MLTQAVVGTANYNIDDNHAHYDQPEKICETSPPASCHAREYISQREFPENLTAQVDDGYGCKQLLRRLNCQPAFLSTISTPAFLS